MLRLTMFVIFLNIFIIYHLSLIIYGSLRAAFTDTYDRLVGKFDPIIQHTHNADIIFSLTLGFSNPRDTPMCNFLYLLVYYLCICVAVFVSPHDQTENDRKL